MPNARVLTLRKKGQLTIPEDVRASLGLQEGQPLWLHVDADDESLVLALRDPRPKRIAEAAAVYRAAAGDDFHAVAEASAPPTRAATLRDLAAILGAGPRLTPDEADAFASDLADIVAEENRAEGGDLWAS